MTPFWQDDHLTLFGGDCREVLATMAPESVHCVVTSPPYWGLRDYGTATWEGGDEACDHKGKPIPTSAGFNERYFGRPSAEDNKQDDMRREVFRETCGKCGAHRIDSQLGLEPTPEEYVANMVAVFREVRRVLRADGTLWLNLGDSYVGANNTDIGGNANFGSAAGVSKASAGSKATWTGLAPKNLVGIPWRVAFALQQPYYTGTIPDERDRTWMSALMDGEGTFTILCTTSSSAGSVSYPPIAQIRMTSQAVVAKAASLVGVASPAQYPPSNRGNRAVYQWRLAGERAASIARELYPYLIEKRRQAMVVWNHQAVRDGYTTKRGVGMPDEARAKQVVCRDIIRRLNHGEHVDLPSWMVEPPGMTEPGWYLRSDVIWSKPNPMPESVTDRPTKAHEYLFLLTKQPRYYFDSDAVREADGGAVARPWNKMNAPTQIPGRRDEPAQQGLAKGMAPGAGRNLRSVWTIATEPYPGAHFATFPRKLVEPCVKAGTSERGVCPECGAPWVRVVERQNESTYARIQREHSITYKDMKAEAEANGITPGNVGGTHAPGRRGAFYEPPQNETTGWRPACTHDAEPVPAVVLDPFAGSGTTLLVAQSLGRCGVGIDLSPEYLKQALARNAQTPLGLVG